MTGIDKGKEGNRQGNKTLKETIGLISYSYFSLLLGNVLLHCSTCLSLNWHGLRGTWRQTEARGKKKVSEASSPAGIQRWRSTLNVGQLSNRALFSPKYRQDRSRLSWECCQKATKISQNVEPRVQWVRTLSDMFFHLTLKCLFLFSDLIKSQYVEKYWRGDSSSCHKLSLHLMMKVTKHKKLP